MLVSMAHKTKPAVGAPWRKDLERLVIDPAEPGIATHMAFGADPRLVAALFEKIAKPTSLDRNLLALEPMN